MKKPLTIGQLARRFGISRSTLLYYDKLGLLQPTGRSESGYRLYGREDIQRMEKIIRFREAGVPLTAIAGVLDDASAVVQALEERLKAIQNEIKQLREQQSVIARLMGEKDLRLPGVITKEQWVQLLRKAGMDDEDMKRWHVEFEKHDPDAHATFLASLSLTEPEISSIQAWSRRGIGK